MFKNVIKEFKIFAIKGNVIDLAVGIVIGSEFNKLVNSLVTDVLTPPIGLLLGGGNFTQLFVSLSRTHYKTLADARDAGAATINYGLFINTILSFLITAFAIFLLVKGINRLRGHTELPKKDPK